MEDHLRNHARTFVLLIGRIHNRYMDVPSWRAFKTNRSRHKLRLEFSSSNFPRFDRKLNTGEEQARATRTVKATNAIYHDKASGGDFADGAVNRRIALTEQVERDDRSRSFPGNQRQ
jgi:hypothetical protein